MAAAWMVSDSALFDQLAAWRAWLATQADYTIRLYTNDIALDGDTTFLDFTEADWDGYEAQDLVGANWGAVAVEDHVAVTVYDPVIEFEADAGIDPEAVFGYYVTDVADNLLWAERFADPITVNPSDTVKVTARMKHKVCPPHA